MLITRRVAVFTMPFLAAVLGCGQEPTRPPVTSILMSLGTTPTAGSPSSPVTFRVSVTNAGQTQVWHCEGCGYGNGVTITVLGPDGKAVLLLDPMRPLPMCPDGWIFPLRPGGTLSGGVGGIVFNGTLYVPYSPTYPTPTYSAPAGRYTVIAGFEYITRLGLGAPEVGIERRTTFDWQP